MVDNLGNPPKMPPIADDEVRGFRAPPVLGYNDQSRDRLMIVNHNKEVEERVMRVLDDMRNMAGVDQRWLAIGRTHIEQGFMAVNRAVFQPGRARLPEDRDPQIGDHGTFYEADVEG